MQQEPYCSEGDQSAGKNCWQGRWLYSFPRAAEMHCHKLVAYKNGNPFPQSSGDQSLRPRCWQYWPSLEALGEPTRGPSPGIRSGRGSPRLLHCGPSPPCLSRGHPRRGPALSGVPATQLLTLIGAQSWDLELTF